MEASKYTVALYILLTASLAGCKRYVDVCDFGTVYPTSTTMQTFQSAGPPQFTLYAYEIAYDKKLREKLSLANLFTLNIINLEDSTRTELFTGIHGKRAVDTTLVPGLYSVQGYHIGHEPVEIDSLEVGVDTHYHLTVKFDTRMLVD